MDSFFFSSRRRHTRYIGDWSSDVCSSDLCSTSEGKRLEIATSMAGRSRRTRYRGVSHSVRMDMRDAPKKPRSEERRVGKEWRKRRGRSRDKNEDKARRL